MLRKKRESVEWLEFELLEEFSTLKHAVFLKNPQENSANIFSQKAVIQEILGSKTLATCHQVHGVKVVDVSLPQPIEPPEGDGLISREKGIGLMISHADCQATILYDPVANVVSNVHAGWRGNVKNMYKEVIDRLKTQYGSSPKNLLVCISPSLGPCCAEFKHYATEFPLSFRAYQETENHFNLWRLAQDQLTECGVLQSHIQIAQICTKCSQDCYSYRRKDTGRHATVAQLV